jgi:acetylornithine deacetylase/succinyl-diaminopimelate desuccinylase-like protein
MLGILGAFCLWATGPGDLQEEVLEYRQVHERAIVAELVELLSIPNVAADAAGIRRNAALLIAMLERRGLVARTLEVEGANPVVFAELEAPGATRTVTFYAHYDGQPADPRNWRSDPWDPQLRDPGNPDVTVRLDGIDGPLPAELRLYARSASDDKAPIVALLAAMDALGAAGRRPSVNVKVFLEGEEEAGSPHLAEILATHRALLETDLWLLCDGPVHQTRAMQLCFGSRGVLGLELEVYGANRELHSGHYGNWAPNPAMELAHLLVSLRDEEGRLRVAGIDDRVREASPADLAALEAIPAHEEALRDELWLGHTEGGGESLSRSILRPALNVRGLRAGEVGSGARNAIPTSAVASIDFRLVPDLRPEDVVRLVEEHLESRGYTLVHEDPGPALRRTRGPVVRLDWGKGYPAYRTSLDTPPSRALAAAVREAVEGPLPLLPMLGGSVPMRVFADATDAPAVVVPMVNHDNHQHAPDENLRLANLWLGVQVYATVLARLGELWSDDPAER